MSSWDFPAPRWVWREHEDVETGEIFTYHIYHGPVTGVLQTKPMPWNEPEVCAECGLNIYTQASLDTLREIEHLIAIEEQFT